MPRKFETDYAGAWRGHCKTRESAINAAMRHLTLHGYRACTITDKETGRIVARLQMAASSKRIVVEVVRPFKEIGL